MRWTTAFANDGWKYVGFFCGKGLEIYKANMPAEHISIAFGSSANANANALTNTNVALGHGWSDPGVISSPAFPSPLFSSLGREILATRDCRVVHLTQPLVKSNLM